jgi:type I restriction enzyme S subunit
MATKKQKISNVPNLRFPGFEGEWKKKKLSEISKLITKGTTPNKFVDQGIKFIKIECFAGDNIDEKKCLFIDEKTHTKELKRSILEENDLLFAIAGATIGKVNIVANEILPANTNQALAIIRLKEEENSSFIYQILKSEIMKKYIKDTISVGAQPNLNLEQINNFSSFQPDLLEQQKIASFLSIIDERIQTQNKIIEQLETLMLGLREKLFTQKLRLKDEDCSEFPEWIMKRLGEVASKKSSNISANKIEDNFGEYIIYGAAGILKHVDFYEEEHDYVSIIKDGAGVGRLLYCNGKSSVLGTMEIIRPKEALTTYFLYCLLSNIDFAKYITGSTIPHIYFKDYSNELCGIPCLKEQTKIANFLYAIDAKIETERGILKDYQRQKQYLLASLFI